MSKGGSQTVTSAPDAATQQYVNQLRQAALGYAGMGQLAAPAPAPMASGYRGLIQRMLGPAGSPPGVPASPFVPPPNPALDAAQAQYQQYAHAGNLGLGALTGGPNPFMNQYLSALNPVYDQIRQQSLGAIGDQAQLAGAFGGDRQGVASGVALGQIGQQQGLANIDAYNQSQRLALQLANLGFGAQAQSAFLPQQYAAGQLGLLQQGIGPYGTTQTQQMQRDPWSQLLGLGLTAGGFLVGGPAGAYAGSQLAGGGFPAFGSSGLGDVDPYTGRPR